ncbi:MAG: hypothetical protein VW954_04400 [Alphaproteobacteria bacterium]
MNIYEHLTIKFSNLRNVRTVLKKFKNYKINIIWSKESLLWLGPHVMNEFKKIINDKKVNLIAEVGENVGLALALIELKVQNITVSESLNKTLKDKIESLASTKGTEVLITEKFIEIKNTDDLI